MLVVVVVVVAVVVVVVTVIFINESASWRLKAAAAPTDGTRGNTNEINQTHSSAPHTSALAETLAGVRVASSAESSANQTCQCAALKVC